MGADVFVHPQGLNESTEVGSGTRIWAFAHVMDGACVGQDCNIGGHAFIEAGAQIGDGVTIKNGVSVWEGVQIADCVFIGPNAVFTNDKYPRSPRGPYASGRYGDKGWLAKTAIGEGATVGANATILSGLTIGRYAMVAAGAVVTRDVKAFALVAGAPAVEVGKVCCCGRRLSAGEEQVCEREGRCMGAEV